MPHSLPRPTSFLCRAGIIVLSAWVSCAALAAEPHPAQTLIDSASAAVRRDPQTSSRDAHAALALLARQPDVDLEIRARLLLCDHLSERDRAAAEQQVALARALLPRARQPGLGAGILNCQGAIVETAGDYAQARELYEKAIKVAATTADDEMLAAALFSRGYLLGLRGRYAAGLIDLKRAQALYKRLQLTDHAQTVLSGIAILYNRMGDYAEARRIYASALQAQRASGMRREQGVTLYNLGRVHENLQQWEQAQEVFEESYRISRELQYARGEAYALRGMAAVANARGEPRRALATLQRAMALQGDTPDARLQAQVQLERGAALHKLGELAQSVAALEEALQVFQEAESLNEMRATYAELAAVHSEMGNWPAAYAQLSEAQRTAARLFRNQVDQRFATLKVEFDTAAKEQQNALLRRENAANQQALEQGQRVRRLQATVIALTVVLAGLLATLALYQWRTTQRMHRLAMTDELTGVPNRRAVLAQLTPLLAPPGRLCAMLIIDIDHFKSINDQHGHPEGDVALKRVAETLRAAVYEPACIGRLGGEEFVVVLPDADLDAASSLAERFRERVMHIDTRRWLAERQITVSIGLTLAKQGGDTPSAMLQRADAALYAAKRAGRNCVRSQLPAEESTVASGVAEPVMADARIKYA